MPARLAHSYVAERSADETPQDAKAIAGRRDSVASNTVDGRLGIATQRCWLA